VKNASSRRSRRGLAGISQRKSGSSASASANAAPSTLASPGRAGRIAIPGLYSPTTVNVRGRDDSGSMPDSVMISVSM